MKKANEMNAISKAVREERERAIEQRAIAFCDTTVQNDITLNANHGYFGAYEIKVPADISLNIVKEYLTENGYTVKETNNNTIDVEW